MKKGYIKRGGVIVSMYGDIICDNESCPYIDDIGNCTDVNAKCKYKKQKSDAILNYAFADDKPVEFDVIDTEKGVQAVNVKGV